LSIDAYGFVHRCLGFGSVGFKLFSAIFFQALGFRFFCSDLESSSSLEPGMHEWKWLRNVSFFCAKMEKQPHHWHSSMLKIKQRELGTDVRRTMGRHGT
jgi:hypothetical protein